MTSSMNGPLDGWRFQSKFTSYEPLLHALETHFWSGIFCHKMCTRRICQLDGHLIRVGALRGPCRRENESVYGRVTWTSAWTIDRSLQTRRCASFRGLPRCETKIKLFNTWLRNWFAGKNYDNTVIFMIIFITDMNQLRTITDTFIPLQSRSTLYRRTKLTSAQYKHRYVNTCSMSIIEFYLHWITTC